MIVYIITESYMNQLICIKGCYANDVLANAALDSFVGSRPDKHTKYKVVIQEIVS